MRRVDLSQPELEHDDADPEKPARKCHRKDTAYVRGLT